MEQPKKDFKLTEVEGCTHRYVDVAHVEGTLYGFEIHAGKRGSQPTNPEDLFDHKVSAVLHMSPQHMKDMACVLLDNVVAYEKKFGEINSQFVIEEVRISKKEGPSGMELPPVGVPGVN